MIKHREEQTHHRPLVVAETVIVVDDGAPTVSTAFQLVQGIGLGERFVSPIALRQFLELHEVRWGLAAVPGTPPVLKGVTFALDVDLMEDDSLLV